MSKKMEAMMMVALTVINLLGFIMIGPFTPFTLFIGLPTGLLAIVYAGGKTLSPSSKALERVFAGLLVIANGYLLYLSLRLL